MEPDVARRSWRALEPYHAMIYFAPEAQEEYAALGLDVVANRAVGYFPARAAALGRVGPGVVQATFFNFSRSALREPRDLGAVNASSAPLMNGSRAFSNFLWLASDRYKA